MGLESRNQMLIHIVRFSILSGDRRRLSSSTWFGTSMWLWRGSQRDRRPHSKAACWFIFVWELGRSCLRKQILLERRLIKGSLVTVGVYDHWSSNRDETLVLTLQGVTIFKFLSEKLRSMNLTCIKTLIWWIQLIWFFAILIQFDSTFCTLLACPWW